MIERRLRCDQCTYDLVVAEMRGGDQRRAVIGAGDVARLAAAVERGFQHRHVVGDRRDGDDVVFLRLERIGVGAEPHQRACGVRLAHEGGNMERRAGVAVARIDRRARLHELLNFGDVALCRRRVQAAIGLQLGRLGGVCAEARHVKNKRADSDRVA